MRFIQCQGHKARPKRNRQLGNNWGKILCLNSKEETEFNMEIMIPLTGGVERIVIAKNSVFRFSFLICQPKTEQKMLAWSKWQKK